MSKVINHELGIIRDLEKRRKSAMLEAARIRDIQELVLLQQEALEQEMLEAIARAQNLNNWEY